MKYYCYNCSETPCILEVKRAGDTVPFMCPWCKVEHFPNWITEAEIEKYLTKTIELKGKPYEA